MIFQIMDRGKKKRFVEGVSDFGIEKIDEVLVKWGNERIRAYSGDFSREEIEKLRFILPVEGIGLYVGKDAVNKRTGEHEHRLSLDAVSVWGDKIVKNILEINEEQEEVWFTGTDVDLSEEQVGDLHGFVAVKSKKDGDFVGIGKLGAGNILYNFLPKERRRKVNVIT